MTAVLGGCDLHGETRESVLARWNDPRIATSKAPVTLCADCDGPALAEMHEAQDEAGNALPGGVSGPVLCSRCKVVTTEQWEAIIARLNEGEVSTVGG